MMLLSKPVLPLVVSVFLLAACTGIMDESTPKSVGMANPASVYCAGLNGDSEVRTGSDGGEYALCHLPDGTFIEEWELFRRDHQQAAE